MGVTDLKLVIFSVFLLGSVPILLMKGLWVQALVAALVGALAAGAHAIRPARRGSTTQNQRRQ